MARGDPEELQGGPASALLLSVDTRSLVTGPCPPLSSECTGWLCCQGRCLTSPSEARTLTCRPVNSAESAPAPRAVSGLRRDALKPFPQCLEPSKGSLLLPVTLFCSEGSAGGGPTLARLCFSLSDLFLAIPNEPLPGPLFTVLGRGPA